MTRSLRVINLTLSAAAGAMFVGTRAAVSPSVSALPTDAYVVVQQSMIRNLIPVMRWLMPAAVGSTVVALLTTRSRRAVGFTAAGLSCQMAMGAITQRVNMPINRDVLGWAPDTLPANWQQRRDRWERWHTARAALAVAGHAALAAAAVSAEDKA